MAQSHPNLGRLEPFYGTYKQVTANGKNDRATLTMTEKILNERLFNSFTVDRKTGDTQTDPRKI